MLHVEHTTKFKRDLQLAKRRNKNMASLQEVMKHIEHEKPLSLHYKDHPCRVIGMGTVNFISKLTGY